MRLLLIALALFSSSLLYAQNELTARQQDSGQTTYEHFCINCHQDGVAGAPKFANVQDWKQRLSGKSLNDLVHSAIKGLNVMPPQGTCTECSEEDIKQAIQYMLPKND